MIPASAQTRGHLGDPLEQFGIIRVIRRRDESRVRCEKRQSKFPPDLAGLESQLPAQAPGFIRQKSAGEPDSGERGIILAGKTDHARRE